MLWTSGTRSFEEFVDWCAAFDLRGLEGRIACPTLAVCGSGEGGEAIRQTREFAANVAGPVDVAFLDFESGADNHVGIGNITHTAGLVFDWLARVLQAGRAEDGCARLDGLAIPGDRQQIVV